MIFQQVIYACVSDTGPKKHIHLWGYSWNFSRNLMPYPAKHKKSQKSILGILQSLLIIL